MASWRSKTTARDERDGLDRLPHRNNAKAECGCDLTAVEEAEIAGIYEAYMRSNH